MSKARETLSDRCRSVAIADDTYRDGCSERTQRRRDIILRGARNCSRECDTRVYDLDNSIFLFFSILTSMLRQIVERYKIARDNVYVDRARLLKSYRLSSRVRFRPARNTFQRVRYYPPRETEDGGERRARGPFRALTGRLWMSSSP